MRILMIHNFHRSGSASGDDQVFLNEKSLLESKGHEVYEYSCNNDSYDNANVFKKVMFTLGMLWSFKYYNDVKRIIKKVKPDVVHIHTFFPLLSPSILKAAKKYCGHVVATLHDTRFICPCATSLRDNKVCNLCIDGKYKRMIKYKCFKNSKIQSAIVSVVFKYHFTNKSFKKYIDKYICLNDTQKELLIKAGFEENKIYKKYNFYHNIEENVEAKETLPDKFVVYYGRLGIEKGTNFLMKAWDDEKLKDINLVVIGAGPLAEEVNKWAYDKKNVTFLGYKKHNECLSIVSKASYVVFPSIWYEGCSMVVVESEFLSKPVIASNIGFTKEAISDGVNGYKFEINNKEQFIDLIIKLWNDEEQLSKLQKNAYNDFLTKYEIENNYQTLLNIYHQK